MTQTTQIDKLNEIGCKLADKIERQLENVSVEFHEFQGHLLLYVGVKFMEISEAVSESLQYTFESDSEFSEEENEEVDEEIEKLNEEQLEALFYERYQEELDEINNQYTVYVNASIQTEKYNIEIEPLECEGDYCLVGLVAEIEIKKELTDIDIDNIVSLIAAIYQL